MINMATNPRNDSVKIEDHAKLSRRSPGETKIFLELQGLDIVTESEVADNREKSRRSSVKKTKFFVKIFFNGKEACHSASKHLTDTFSVNIGQIFPLRILQWPESLRIQLFEGSTIKTTKLAEVIVPLCDSSVSLDVAKMEELNFECSLKVTHDHTGLGSGVEFSANVEGSELKSEMIRGKVFVRIGWAKTFDGVILAPPKDKWRPPYNSGNRNDPLKEILNLDGKIDAEMLEDWMIKNKIDPNDPSNLELMERVAEINSQSYDRNLTRKSRDSINLSLSNVPSLPGGHFRLDNLQDQFAFCDPEDPNKSIRLQLFKLRKSQIPEFRNFRMIPILEKEIPKGLIEIIERKVREERKSSIGISDPLRGPSRIYLEHLRSHVGHCFSIARHRKQHGDVIREDPIPTLGRMASLLGEIAPAQRPLKPVRVPRNKVALKEGEEVKILLQVIRAYDVPIRKEHDPLQSQTSLQVASSTHTLREGVREAMVQSYVQVQFQGQSARTTVAAGPNPCWNQHLILKFKPINNDYSPDTLNRVKDRIHIHLFDEVSIDMIDEDSERETHVHQRFERKWLGSLSLPFASLFQNTQVEGTFRLHSPPVLLGYERLVGTNNIDVYTENPMFNRPVDSTFLNLFVTLDPPLSVSEPIKEKLDCDENENLIHRCERWSRDLEYKFPHRKVHALVPDVNGKSILVTKYLRSIKPPEELLDSADSKVSVAKVAWFVSLIPYLPRNAIFPGLPDIWPSCEETMLMLCGSEVEHSILLSNFFTYLGKKSFLVLGEGIPEGKTVYVLTVEENGEHWLWNSVAGEHFVAGTNFCPLQSIFAIIDDTNVWGNIQPSESPIRMRWDLSSTSDWIPLFSSSFPNPTSSSIQPSSLTFSPPDSKASNSLKERIERNLRQTLRTLRKKEKTISNYLAIGVLKKLLPGLERAKYHLQPPTAIAAEHLSELHRLSSSHKVCGFPLHFSYHDQEQMTEALKSTNVHLNRDPNVEFALAVHVEPYPANIMSVWIYVATVIRRT